MSINVGELVDKYIKLRDSLAEDKKQFEANIARKKELMDRVEAKILEIFNETGVESCRTEGGTAYRSTRVSVTTADPYEFREFVQANEAWDLLEIRPAKKAVESYAESKGALPPGVNMSRQYTINIRRS